MGISGCLESRKRRVALGFRSASKQVVHKNGPNDGAVRDPHPELLFGQGVGHRVIVLGGLDMVIETGAALLPFGVLAGLARQRLQRRLVERLEQLPAGRAEMLCPARVEIVQQLTNGLVQFREAEETVISQAGQDPARQSESGSRRPGRRRVKPTGSKQWVQRLVVKGRRRDIGLGGYPLVSLAEAREAAFTNRKLARAGGDPLTLQRRPDIPTFEAAAEAVIALHAENWKDSGRTAALWQSSLRRYAFPRLGHRLVSDITVADVMAVLVADDFWNHKRETAKKVRRRISTTMKWVVAQGFRNDNPAGEVLGAALPRNSKAVEHYAAVSHAEVANAIVVIRASSATISTKLALEFLILTACRSG